MLFQENYSRARMSITGLVLATVLSACASAPFPKEQVAISKDAVDRAESAGATRYAPLEMKIAQDKLFIMERDLGGKNYAQAKLLAEQIEVDAKLAERKANAARLQKQLRDAQKGVQRFKNEMLQDINTNTEKNL